MPAQPGKSPTLTPADARELLDRALWFERQDLFNVPGSDARRRLWRATDTETRHEETAKALLRAAARLAGYAGDPALLPLVIQALDAHGEADEFDRGASIAPFAETITWLLQLGAPVDDDVRALARHSESEVRCALIHGLKDAVAEFESLVRPLADDPDPQVRSTAKEALAALGAPPWWVGVFSFDPATVITAADGAALSEQLGRYAELVNHPHGTWGDAREEMFGLIEAFPDALARDAILRALQADRFMQREERLAKRLARVPDSVQDLIKLLERSERYRHYEFAKIWAANAVGDREALARSVIAAIDRRDPAERTNSASTTWSLTDVVANLWPPTADATDLVERILAAIEPEDDDDRMRIDAFTHMVDSIATHSPATVERCGPRLVAAFLEGDPQRWCRHLRRSTSAALDALPLEARREAARKALTSQNDEVANWALDQLLGPSHDPERDPPVDELFDQLCADARLRALLTERQHHVKAHRSQCLALLHDGKLPLPSAAFVVMTLAAPGQTMRDEFMYGNLDDLGGKRPEAEGPPLTDEDFLALRRIREATTGPPTHEGLFSLAGGPLSPEDRAYVERARIALDAGNDRLEIGVLVTLAVGGTAEDVPVVERLARRDSDDDMTASIPERMKARLGLIPPKVRGAPRRPAPAEDDESAEWMDEDD